jgi:hypothetical protein
MTTLTIEDLGWTREQALAARGLFACMAEDWDDPAMDVYDHVDDDQQDRVNWWAD